MRGLGTVMVASVASAACRRSLVYRDGAMPSATVADKNKGVTMDEMPDVLTEYEAITNYYN